MELAEGTGTRTRNKRAPSIRSAPATAHARRRRVQPPHAPTAACRCADPLALMGDGDSPSPVAVMLLRLTTIFSGNDQFNTPVWRRAGACVLTPVVERVYARSAVPPCISQPVAGPGAGQPSANGPRSSRKSRSPAAARAATTSSPVRSRRSCFPDTGGCASRGRRNESDLASTPRAPATSCRG